MKLLSRTIEVLNALAEAPDGMGVTRLAESLDESPSTIHRLLTALSRYDYVVRDGDRRYRLGVGVLSLANAFQRHDQLVIVAAPHLSRLVAETRESVFLSKRIGDDVVCVASVESPRPLKFYMGLGQRTPYHAASSARAILAFKPSSERKRLIEAEELEAFTPNTPRTVVAAMEALEATRSQGYAVCDGELEVGVTALSVPLATATGEIDASLTLVAPQDRLSGADRPEAARRLKQAGARISADLGYRTPTAIADPFGEHTDAGRASAANAFDLASADLT